MKAHEAPTRDVVAVGPNTTVGEILASPIRPRISPVPVVNEVMDLVGQTDLPAGSESATGKKRRWWWLKLSANPYVSQCAYCGSSAFGPGCSYAPRGLHRHQTDERHCEYCGSTAYGRGCSYSPFKVHRHGAGSRCRWCGSIALGMGCTYYPTGMHE